MNYHLAFILLFFIVYQCDSVPNLYDNKKAQLLNEENDYGIVIGPNQNDMTTPGENDALTNNGQTQPTPRGSTSQKISAQMKDLFKKRLPPLFANKSRNIVR